MAPVALGPERHDGLDRRTARQRTCHFRDQDRGVVRELEAGTRPLPHPVDRQTLVGALLDEAKHRALYNVALESGVSIGGTQRWKKCWRLCGRSEGVEKVVAVGRGGRSRTEIREYPMPDIPEDAALMKMEVAGICGTDVKLYAHPPNDKPTIMGHENIGVIAKAGREFTR